MHKIVRVTKISIEKANKLRELGYSVMLAGGFQDKLAYIRYIYQRALDLGITSNRRIQTSIIGPNHVCKLSHVRANPLGKKE